ncbi:MAG: tyrosine-type recombinase/integrase [Thermoflexales bacterium]|nr:tyrosine-type recombinase/integrase [Thermoflexales bacterium]MDW8350755.1 tyrosine-type recombinase/integrase [Anaerolineae bacterium]
MATVIRLDEALLAYAKHLERRPISDNTRKAFWGDVNLFARFVVAESRSVPPLTAITADRIRAFIAHEERRANANNPKSVERRLTSVKVFFRWLRECGYIAVDPAEGVPYKPLVDPLPAYLTEAQAAAVLQAARRIAAGARADTRPLAVIHLVLETGIKKSECLRLTRDDLDRDARRVWIRYDKKHLKFKERQLPISAECAQVLDEHIRRRQPRGRLFDCTGRNLEYIFNRKIAPQAGLSSLTFEMMRWTCALRDYRAGAMDEEQLQYKYGLSPLAWKEMEAKLARIVRHETDRALDARLDGGATDEHQADD